MGVVVTRPSNRDRASFMSSIVIIPIGLWGLAVVAYDLAPPLSRFPKRSPVLQLCED